MEAMGEQAAEKLLWQTSTSLTYTFGGTGEDHAGCSKRPTSTAAGESNPEEVPTSLRGAVRPYNGSWRTEKPLQHFPPPRISIRTL